MNQYVEDAKLLNDYLLKCRRHIHQNPEIGMDTHETAAFVKAELEDMGYEASYIAETGVTATVGGKKPGKCFLLRADMDALPIEEDAAIDFKSTNGNMHACGHDFHTAMLLGAAKLLKSHEDEIPGTVKFMFQPAEEDLKGGRALVEAGILENPKVDAACMFHVMTGTPYPTGTIILPQPGASTAASDWFEIFIKGKGGHGAMPQLSVDPLNIMSHLHIALQEINSREIAPSDVLAFTVGKMQGGSISNVIPDTAEMYGTIRTYDPAVRELVLKRVEEISKGVAATFRGTADVNLIMGAASVMNDPEVIATAMNGLSDAFGAEKVTQTTDKMSGSEDFAYVSSEVPAVMMLISAGNEKEGYTYPVHHPKVVFDETVLSSGAAAYAIAAISWLEENK